MRIRPSTKMGSRLRRQLLFLTCASLAGLPSNLISSGKWCSWTFFRISYSAVSIALTVWTPTIWLEWTSSALLMRQRSWRICFSIRMKDARKPKGLKTVRAMDGIPSPGFYPACRDGSPRGGEYTTTFPLRDSLNRAKLDEHNPKPQCRPWKLCNFHTVWGLSPVFSSLEPVGALQGLWFVVRRKGFGILEWYRDLIVTILQLCSLFGVLHETAFVFWHLRLVSNDGFSEVPIVEIFYHLLQLAVDFNKEAWCLRCMAMTR